MFVGCSAISWSFSATTAFLMLWSFWGFHSNRESLKDKLETHYLEEKTSIKISFGISHNINTFLKKPNKFCWAGEGFRIQNCHHQWFDETLFNNFNWITWNEGTKTISRYKIEFSFQTFFPNLIAFLVVAVHDLKSFYIFRQSQRQICRKKKPSGQHNIKKHNLKTF